MADEGPTTVGSIDGKLSLDIDDWKAKVAVVKADAAELGATRPDIKVDADTSHAQEQMAAVDAAAAAMGASATTSAQRVKSASDDVATAQARVTASLSAVETASARAAIAQQRLTELQDSGAAKASTLMGAELALSEALSKLDTANEKATASETALAEAQQSAARSAAEEAAAATGAAAAQSAGVAAKDSAALAEERLRIAQMKLADLQASGTASATQLASAELAVAAAMKRVEDANNSAGSSAGGAASRIALIVTAVAGVIALAGPLAGAATAVGGAFAGMGAAGVLAVLGIVAAMKDGNVVGSQYSAGLKVLKGDLDSLGSTAATQMLDSFNAAVALINGEMPDLNNEIGTFTQMLGTAGVTGLQAAINLFRVGYPLFVQGADVIEDIADGFEDWTANGGLQKFASYAEQELPQVVDTLGDIGSAIEHVVEAAAPIGGAVLTAVDDVAKAIGAIPVPMLTAAAAGALALWASFQIGNGVGSVVDKVTASVGKLMGAETAAATKTMSLGSSVSAAAGWFGVAVGAVTAAIAAVDSWKQSVEDAVASDSKLQNAITTDSDAAGGFSDAMKAVNAWNDTGKTTTQQMSDALKSAANGWGGMIRPEFRSVLSFWRMDSCQDRIRTSSVSARCGC